MSDTPREPGWRKASDGGWHQPELHPAHQTRNPALPPSIPQRPSTPLFESAVSAAAGISAEAAQQHELSYKRRWFTVPTLSVLLIVIASCAAPSNDDGSSAMDGTAAPTERTSNTAPSNPVATQPATDSDLTTSQQNAVRSAQSYLDFAGFSRQGLIDQLSSEYGDQYSVQDATVAVDSLNVDWNAEAVESAKSYLDLSGFSCQGLIDQLSSEYGDQYTVAQATYAATQVGLC